MHKGGESEMNYIKIFQNLQALSVSVGKSNYEYQLMHILLGNFHQVRKYFTDIKPPGRVKKRRKIY